MSFNNHIISRNLARQHTADELLAMFKKQEERVDEAEDAVSDAKADLDRASRRLERIADAWREVSKDECDCRLIGIRCKHGSVNVEGELS